MILFPGLDNSSPKRLNSKSVLKKRNLGASSEMGKVAFVLDVVNQSLRLLRKPPSFWDRTEKEKYVFDGRVSDKRQLARS